MKLHLRLLVIALAAIGFAAPAQANVQLPGGNGKILFTSNRDFPFDFSLTARGISEGSCQEDSNNGFCGLELYSINPDGTAPTRLTNNLSGDDEGAWSPIDGSHIAFQSNRLSSGDCTEGCSQEIWSMVSDGSSPVQLTNDGQDARHPSYSPDESHIAFEQGVFTKELTAKIRVGYQDKIMVMPAAGEGTGPAVPLRPDGETGQTQDGAVFDSYPAWSPDGTQIAFTRLVEIDPPNKGSLATFDIRTYVAPADGSGTAQPVETFPICTFQPIIFPGPFDELNSTLASKGLAAGLRSLVSRGSVNAGCMFDIKPAWSPDGQRLAATRLFGSTEGPSGPGLARAGTRGFTSPQDLGDIVVFNRDGSGDVDLSDLSEFPGCGPGQFSKELPCSIDEYPSWSPDGTKIAFDSNRLPDGSGPGLCEIGSGDCDFEIYTMNPDGSQITKLTDNSSDDVNPDWQRTPPPVTQPPVPVQPASPQKPTVGVAGVRRACVAGAFHVRFRVSTAASTVKSVVVKLDGKRIKRTSKGSFTLTINGKKLKSGKHRLTITATNAAGQVTTRRRTFSVCKAAKPRRRAAPRFTG
jgi:hypothetical protein